MALADMEELISTVDDKEVSAFLREVLVCYGAGAYRACIVLTHIALFDGIRRKILALAPVNKVAKAVSEEIELIAEAQKPFETVLIHRLKAAKIVTELEAQLLVSLNDHRNKAAHPSGHTVSAEEARYVFTEAVRKFISPPIRQTSYVVDQIVAKISDKNFFPSKTVVDMDAVVADELANLDPSALPFLLTRLAEAREATDTYTVQNAEGILIALASRRDPEVRSILAKKMLEPKSSNSTNAEFFSVLIAADPELLQQLGAVGEQRMKALLMEHANSAGIAGPYNHLRSPLQILANSLQQLGEGFLLAKYSEFSFWIVDQVPYAPDFVECLASSPQLGSALLRKYLARASSSDFTTANGLANNLASLDEPLSSWIGDAQSFELLASVGRAAQYGAFSSGGILASSFAGNPKLKAKARSFAETDIVAADEICDRLGIHESGTEFLNQYLK